jgi:hypothetical protein
MDDEDEEDGPKFDPRPSHPLNPLHCSYGGMKYENSVEQFAYILSRISFYKKTRSVRQLLSVKMSKMFFQFTVYFLYLSYAIFPFCVLRYQQKIISLSLVAILQ